MNRTTLYRVKALGLLWSGHDTWGEKTVDFDPIVVRMRGRHEVRRLFADFGTLTDYEVTKIEEATHNFPLTGKTLPASQLSNVIERTITDRRETIVRPWSDPASEETYDGFISGELDVVEGVDR